MQTHYGLTVCKKKKKSLSKHFPFISQSNGLARAAGLHPVNPIVFKRIREGLDRSSMPACRHYFVCVDKSGWREVFQETGPVTHGVLLLPPYRAEWKRAVSIYGPRVPHQSTGAAPEQRPLPAGEHFLRRGESIWMSFFTVSTITANGSASFMHAKRKLFGITYFLGVLLWSKK